MNKTTHPNKETTLKKMQTMFVVIGGVDYEGDFGLSTAVFDNITEAEEYGRYLLQGRYGIDSFQIFERGMNVATYTIDHLEERDDRRINVERYDDGRRDGDSIMIGYKQERN